MKELLNINGRSLNRPIRKVIFMKKYFMFGIAYFFALQGCIRLIELIQNKQWKDFEKIYYGGKYE